MPLTYFYCSYTGSGTGFQLVSDESRTDLGDGCFEPLEKKAPDPEWRFIDRLMIQSLFDFAYGKVPDSRDFFVLVKRLEGHGDGDGLPSRLYLNLAFVFSPEEKDDFGGFVMHFLETYLNKRDWRKILAIEASKFVVPDGKVDFCGIKVKSDELRRFLASRGENEIPVDTAEASIRLMRLSVPDKSDHGKEIEGFLNSLESGEKYRVSKMIVLDRKGVFSETKYLEDLVPRAKCFLYQAKKRGSAKSVRNGSKESKNEAEAMKKAGDRAKPPLPGIIDVAGKKIKPVVDVVKSAEPVMDGAVEKINGAIEVAGKKIEVAGKKIKPVAESIMQLPKAIEENVGKPSREFLTKLKDDSDDGCSNDA